MDLKVSGHFSLSFFGGLRTYHSISYVSYFLGGMTLFFRLVNNFHFFLSGRLVGSLFSMVLTEGTAPLFMDEKGGEINLD